MPAYCIDPLPKSAYSFTTQVITRRNERKKRQLTYFETGKAEVANLHLVVLVDQNILSFDVAVDNAQLVHVEEHPCGVECHAHPQL